MQEAHSCDISASPERTHPEASLSHFTKKTDRCPYPESSPQVSGFSPAVQLELEALQAAKVPLLLLQCLFANPPTVSFALAAECLFRPKPRFQSGHFYEAKSSNEATNSHSKTW